MFLFELICFFFFPSRFLGSQCKMPRFLSLIAASHIFLVQQGLGWILGTCRRRKFWNWERKLLVKSNKQTQKRITAQLWGCFFLSCDTSARAMQTDFYLILWEGGCAAPWLAGRGVNPSALNLQSGVDCHTLWNRWPESFRQLHRTFCLIQEVGGGG